MSWSCWPGISPTRKSPLAMGIGQETVKRHLKNLSAVPDAGNPQADRAPGAVAGPVARRIAGVLSVPASMAGSAVR
ncbi:hypothetical protein ACU4GD_21645 [Cupriavidus basilensis]